MTLTDQSLEDLWLNTFLEVSVRNRLTFVTFREILVSKLGLRVLSAGETKSHFLDLTLEALG
jgi:hypothetical protein